MKKRIFEFTCPHCGASFFLCRDTYLVREEKGAEYQRLRDGTFFVHQCQSCKKLFDLEYPLIYKDPVRGFLIINSQSRPEGLKGQCILTRNTRQFLEAFSILDAGARLMDVLPIKKRLEALKKTACSFSGYDEKSGMVWFDCRGELVGVKLK